MYGTDTYIQTSGIDIPKAGIMVFLSGEWA